MLTVKKSSHKIRSRDLFSSLMCYSFKCCGSKNNTRTRVKVRVCIIYRMDVVARIDRRVDGSTILQLSSSLTLTGRDGCIESNSKSLYRAREVKPIERFKSRVRVAEENRLFSSFEKKYYRVSWAQRASSKLRLGVI